MFVTKASGEREEFSKEKIKRTCIRAGASKVFAENVANEVYKRAYNGITTRKILEITLSLLKKEPVIATRYDLKRAIMSLGPTGFPFEKFFAALLENYNYSTAVNQKISGLCVSHEVDINAKKDLRYMIECKYHNRAGIYTDLKVALYTYARFLDLKKHFDMPWLVCNTKISRDAIKYSRCNNIKITSWSYPRNESLQNLIEKKKLYPITSLKSVNKFAVKKLIDSGFILAKDLLKYNIKNLKRKISLSDKVLNNILREVESLYYGKF